MKKYIIILLLSLAAISLQAERLVLLQGTYLNTNRIQETGGSKSTDNFSEFGFNVTSFIGKKFGIYSSVSFLLPFSRSQSGIETKVSLSNYTKVKIGMDMLLGVGYKHQVSESLSVLFGGGVHFNGIALMSKDSSIERMLRYNIGPGVAVNAVFDIFKGFNFNIGVMGAWDVLEFLTIPSKAHNEKVRGGFTFAASAGIGFSY